MDQKKFRTSRPDPNGLIRYEPVRAFQVDGIRYSRARKVRRPFLSFVEPAFEMKAASRFRADLPECSGRQLVLWTRTGMLSHWIDNPPIDIADDSRIDQGHCRFRADLPVLTPQEERAYLKSGLLPPE